VFRKEIADDDGRIRTVGFFLTKGAESKPDYQMYGLYQQFREGYQQDLELAKKEMDSNTIKEASMAGYSGIEGLIMGPKTRFITTVLKDGKLFSVSTMPPSQENKELTNQILTTFEFK
jgi:ABC-type transport system substrate-binding protein